jgi:hypothetical protein
MEEETSSHLAGRGLANLQFYKRLQDTLILFPDGSAASLPAFNIHT